MQNNRCMREIDTKKLRSKIKNHTHIDSAKNDVRLEIVAGFGGGAALSPVGWKNWESGVVDVKAAVVDLLP